MVGHPHPSVWTLLSALQMDQSVASADLILNSRGLLPKKRVKRSVAQHQDRLKQLCVDRRDGKKTVAEALRAFGHCVRMA